MYVITLCLSILGWPYHTAMVNHSLPNTQVSLEISEIAGVRWSQLKSWRVASSQSYDLEKALKSPETKKVSTAISTFNLRNNIPYMQYTCIYMILKLWLNYIMFISSYISIYMQSVIYTLIGYAWICCSMVHLKFSTPHSIKVAPYDWSNANKSSYPKHGNLGILLSPASGICPSLTGEAKVCSDLSSRLTIKYHATWRQTPPSKMSARGDVVLSDVGLSVTVPDAKAWV